MEFKEIFLQKQVLDRLSNIEEALKVINEKLDNISVSNPIKSEKKI